MLKQRFIVFIDESGFCKQGLRTHGWSVKGQRCYGQYNWSIRDKTNVIGALHDGELLAVGLFECNINSTVFEAWVKQVLLPELPPNSVLVMDNAAFHKRQILKEIIENVGHEILWLPPYSPDLNPIEKKWAQLKRAFSSLKTNCIDKLFESYMTCKLA